MHRMNYMAGWSRTTFYMMTALIAGLWLSGCVMYWLPAEALPEMTATQETIRRASNIVHGVLSWFFCVMIGRGVWPHAWVMWRRHTQPVKWILGVSNLVLLGFLVLGGLVLLYGSPVVHDVLSRWHFWVGALGPMFYVAHTWRRFVVGL